MLLVSAIVSMFCNVCWTYHHFTARIGNLQILDLVKGISSLNCFCHKRTSCVDNKQQGFPIFSSYDQTFEPFFKNCLGHPPLFIRKRVNCKILGVGIHIFFLFTRTCSIKNEFSQEALPRKEHIIFPLTFHKE